MRFLFQNMPTGIIDVVYEDGCHWIVLKPLSIGPKAPNLPEVQYSAIFSKTVRTVLRFLFQNMPIGVIDVVNEDGCHWIALKPPFVGPKGPNRPKIQFSVIFSKTVQTVLKFLLLNKPIGVIDVLFEDGCHWFALKPRFVGPKSPNRPEMQKMDSKGQ